MSTAWPAIPIKNWRLDLNESKASTESLFTRRRQVVSVSGATADRWEGMVETPVLSAADVKTLFAFLVAVGIYGDITIGDPDYSGPTSGMTSCLVDGAGQSGMSINLKGMPTSVTSAKAGDYFQIGTQFFMLTADLTSNGSGHGTASFKPALRASPGDGAGVVWNTPVMTAKLTSIPSKQTDELKMASFQVSFEEAL